MDQMEYLNRKEMTIRYGTIGFVLGVLLTVMIHLMLIRAVGSDFTFRELGILHQKLWFLYLVDLLPLPGILLGSMAGTRRYQQMNDLALRVEQESEKKEEIKRFTRSLIAGDLSASIDFSDEDRSLAEILNRLKDTLERNREMEQQRRLEERHRNWVSEGLATFGDILRTHAGSPETMAYEVISSMVKYLDANQGAIFMTEEDGGEKFLRMIACHAYGRKKFPDKRIPWGDGLIGAAALEKKGYVTDKIPDGYLTITSGLGKANPDFLVIEPLVWNDKVFGIMEIAAFKRMEDFKLQFIHRVAENIATTISTMESNLRTEQLLRETREQADQLALQEEKVRQHMETLEQTQIEAAQQAEKFISFTNTVNHTLMRADYDTEGRLIYANTRFLKKMGYSGNREVEGKHITMFINEKDRAWFNTLWERLSEGGRHFEGYMKHETRLGQDLWTIATYTCMRRDDGTVEKILFLALDSTEQKKQSLDYEGQMEAIDRLNARAVFTPDGKLQLSNALFGKILKYPEKELAQMKVFDFLSTTDQERFSEIWEKVVRGEPFQGQMKMLSRYEEELWFRATFLSVDDMYGEVEKVIFLATEITREKEMDMASRKQHEQLVAKEEELRLAGLDLRRKLEETGELRIQEKAKFEKEIRQYQHVLGELPFPLVTINNMGFVLFFNREAEKTWGFKQERVLGNRAGILFHPDNASDVVTGFADPARSKSPGIYTDQEIILPDGKAQKRDMMLIRTDLKEERHFTLILL
ncbi:MAG TPA: PAS domain S-box protein [Bacteroides sp.]|nr:PAS domain S-box protein [Bacteroides sp.]